MGMNFWITKNIRFGYKYATDKTVRSNIIKANKWIIELMDKKGSRDDYFILAGGLFSSTNPSLIAIDDAHSFLIQVSKIMNVVLINCSKDTRFFNKISYSTLNIFKGLPNIRIISETTDLENVMIIPYTENYKGDNIILDVESSEFNSSKIPSLVQLEEDEDGAGVLIYNKKKQIIIKNNKSFSHKIIKITTIDDLINFDHNKYKNYYIHLIIDEGLMNENKLDIEVALHKINPTSVKYTDSYLDSIKGSTETKLSESLNIVDTIYNYIGDNDKLREQFDRVLSIRNTYKHK